MELLPEPREPQTSQSGSLDRNLDKPRRTKLCCNQSDSNYKVHKFKERGGQPYPLSTFQFHISCHISLSFLFTSISPLRPSSHPAFDIVSQFHPRHLFRFTFSRAQNTGGHYCGCRQDYVACRSHKLTAYPSPGAQVERQTEFVTHGLAKGPCSLIDCRYLGLGCPCCHRCRTRKCRSPVDSRQAPAYKSTQNHCLKQCSPSERPPSLRPFSSASSISCSPPGHPQHPHGRQLLLPREGQKRQNKMWRGQLHEQLPFPIPPSLAHILRRVRT